MENDRIDLGYVAPKYENITGTPHSIRVSQPSAPVATDVAQGYTEERGCVFVEQVAPVQPTPSPRADFYDPNATRATAPVGVSEQAQNNYNAGRPSDTVGHTGGSGAYILGFEKKKFFVLIAILVVACVLSSVLGGVIGANLNGNGRNGQNNPNYTIKTSNDMSTTEAVAKKVLSSVVGITSKGVQVSEGDFFGFGAGESEVTGVGTGMIVDKSGYILTNSHVVMDGDVKEITVLLSDGSEVPGTVIWNDASVDLAIVKIEAGGLNPVDLGDSDNVQIGSYVAAIGNPLGLEFNGSITQGVVSGLDRKITASDGGTKTTNMEGLIQVDAAINSGNSGGPLLNSRGEVIGVNTAKASAEGMGFAIPINTAKPIIEKVIKNGSFERVYMGISAADVSVIASNYPNVKLAVEKGAFVTDVTVGSPAEVAGLEVKDIITELDGKAITSSSDLIKRLLNYEAGDVVKIKYNRDGDEKETEVTLMLQSEMSTRG
ncbi:MAG: S1C family serine protease [Clostridiales Family XIII bacterium]|jgi:S1-C subfamily serine protease|nr:S1C family serine protease [Clostridiales Family XIII bacterium]